MTTSRQTGLPVANRNSHKGSVLEGFGFSEEGQTHPGELLFRIDSLEDLLMKSDIPEAMVPVIGRMLWTAERYKIPARTGMVRWYLVSRLGKERRGREEYIEAVIGLRRKQEEEEERLGLKV